MKWMDKSKMAKKDETESIIGEFYGYNKNVSPQYRNIIIPLEKGGKVEINHTHRKGAVIEADFYIPKNKLKALYSKLLEEMGQNEDWSFLSYASRLICKFNNEVDPKELLEGQKSNMKVQVPLEIGISPGRVVRWETDVNIERGYFVKKTKEQDDEYINEEDGEIIFVKEPILTIDKAQAIDGFLVQNQRKKQYQNVMLRAKIAELYGFSYKKIRPKKGRCVSLVCASPLETTQKAMLMELVSYHNNSLEEVQYIIKDDMGIVMSLSIHGVMLKGGYRAILKTGQPRRLNEILEIINVGVPKNARILYQEIELKEKEHKILSAIISGLAIIPTLYLVGGTFIFENRPRPIQKHRKRIKQENWAIEQHFKQLGIKSNRTRGSSCLLMYDRKACLKTIKRKEEKKE